MARGPSVDVYLERGSKRTFASAIDWHGWSCGGKDDDSALEALLARGPRYARALASTTLGFVAPADLSALKIVETLKGDATTDFGAPSAKPRADLRDLTAPDLDRLRRILEACWRAFDRSYEAARGKKLAKGPRGGGRPALAIVKHVLEADAGYLAALGWKYKPDSTSPHALEPMRRAILEGLAASARGEIEERGPRGGKRWPARFHVRRSAWHVLDHAWEIEDRAG